MWFWGKVFVLFGFLFVYLWNRNDFCFLVVVRLEWYDVWMSVDIGIYGAVRVSDILDGYIYL